MEHQNEGPGVTSAQHETVARSMQHLQHIVAIAVVRLKDLQTKVLMALLGAKMQTPVVSFKIGMCQHMQWPYCMRCQQ